ncbi:histidine phosphatase family protein [Peribacillus huizhouensis]|uniref:Alpha-ribazole phosphatase n=1 Tax=Peribacillus huizhouensis TaxID=1501239 RepID=A0ABR6CSR5_9BACI|nr:histidine phosphatase family protein [Peribacillus huizhouensis]MBA9027956.1 alpha-ribazole phosphatase [Peribacillus huizhouensis]
MANGVGITLLRHGMTEANMKKQYVGWTDSPLTAEGLLELERLQSSYPNYEDLYCSDLNRCIQTANILFPKCEPILKEQFREMNFGEWEGRTYEQLLSFPHYMRWLEHPFEIGLPQGECYQDFNQRVLKAWDEMVEEMKIKGTRNIAVVTHGGVIRNMLVYYAPEQKLFWEWSIPYGCGYELYWKSYEQLRRGERCTSLRAVPIMGKENG